MLALSERLRKFDPPQPLLGVLRDEDAADVAVRVAVALESEALEAFPSAGYFSARPSVIVPVPRVADSYPGAAAGGSRPARRSAFQW